MSSSEPAVTSLPGLDDADPRTELRQFVQNVAGDEDRLPHPLQCLEQFADLDSRPRVETGGRFVQQQQIGIVQQHAGQCEPLFHAARQPSTGASRLSVRSVRASTSRIVRSHSNRDS